MSGTKSYLNPHELEGGRILLYNRPNAKKQIWHMRIYVKGMEDISGDKVKYYTKSTGELDLDRAKRVALETYEELRDKVRAAEPVFDNTFETVFNIWLQQKKIPDLQERQKRKNEQRGIHSKPSDKVKWHATHATRYWLEFFGSMPINSITNQVAQDYWQWRLGYWDRASDEERRAYPNHSKTPKLKSLQMERSALREFFAWAKDTARVARIVPEFHHSIFNNTEDARRPSFDKDEWERLDRYMRERWVLGKGVNDKEKGSRLHSLHIHQRQMVRRYIQWLTATGMRPAEPLFLQHKHIKVQTAGDKKFLEIKLPFGKTGSREIVSQPVCVSYYEAIKKQTGYTQPDDYVFCDQHGKPHKGYYRSVQALLEQLGMRKDPATGQNRTAYSFRHYYAEQRLEEAGANLATTADLRASMGTGLAQLEKHYLRKKIYNTENLISYKERQKK